MGGNPYALGMSSQDSEVQSYYLYDKRGLRHAILIRPTAFTRVDQKVIRLVLQLRSENP